MGGDDRGRRTVRPGRQQGRRRAHPQSGGNRLPARLQSRRHHAQREFRHPGDHQLGDGLLRASADARNRLRPPGAADDDIACAISPPTTSKSRSTASPRCASATISIRSRCPRSSRCSRPRSGTISACSRSTSSLIYSIIDVLLGGRRGQTAIRIEGRPYTTIETSLVKRMIEVVLADAEQAFRPLSPVQLQHRPARDQSALRRDHAAGERRDPGAAAHRHGRPRRHHRAAVALRDDRADPRRAAADVHGREVRPRPGLGRPSRDRDRAGGHRGRGGAVRGRAAAASS